MRIRYLKGNQAGLLDELPERDARAAIADGYAEAYVPPAAEAPKAPAAPKTTTARARTTRTRSR